MREGYRLASGYADIYVTGAGNTGANAMSNGLTRFLGDTPGRTVLKLLVVSLVAGVVMSAFDWYPQDILLAVRDAFVNLWDTGFAALGRFGSYIALGAVIVVPAFILIRLLNWRR